MRKYLVYETYEGFFVFDREKGETANLVSFSSRAEAEACVAKANGVIERDLDIMSGITSIGGEA